MQTTDNNSTSLAPRVMIGHVIRAVCIECKVSKSDLIGPRRHWTLLRPRQVGMMVARELTGASLPAIGAAFGGRDHTTALCGIRRMRDLAQVDARLRADIAAVRARSITLSGGQPPPPSAVMPVPIVDIQTADVVTTTEERKSLTEAQIAEAQKLKDKGWSVNGLSRRYEVPVEIICDAVGERDWKRAAA